jgi:hypothetical protein
VAEVEAEEVAARVAGGAAEVAEVAEVVEVVEEEAAEVAALPRRPSIGAPPVSDRRCRLDPGR